MRMFSPQGLQKVPTNAKMVFQGKLFDVYQWEQEMFDGSVEIFEMLKRPDLVHTIAIKDGKIAVMEQEQPVAGFFYSFPGGRHDNESENELEAAQREMLEETGMRFKNWKLISAVQSYKKIECVLYTFLCTDFIDQREQKLDVGEKIKVTLKTFDEVRNLIEDPKTRDLAKDIFQKVSLIQELIDFPECK